MVSAPTDDYIKWAQKAYPDEKTKLFPMSPERLCLFIKYTNIPTAFIPHLISHLSTHPKHGSEWCVKVREHPALVELLSTPTKDHTKAVGKQPSSTIKTSQCVVVEGEKAKGFFFFSSHAFVISCFD